MRIRTRTGAAAAVGIVSLAAVGAAAQAGSEESGVRDAVSYINTDVGTAFFNVDIDPRSSCAKPDHRDSDQRFSDPAATGPGNRNGHNDAGLFSTKSSSRQGTRSDVDGTATYDSSGVGEISACPDPDNAGPKTSARTDTNGDGRFDRCTQTGFQEKNAAGDGEFHARMNNDGSPRLGGEGKQTVVFCHDPDANGCADEAVKREIAIDWES